MKNPFIDLIIKFDRLNVAPELAQTFKNVLRRMAVYFEANGYLDKRDYTEMFKKYLIDGDFKFEVSDEPSKIGASGFFQHHKNRIVIDSKYMDTGIIAEQVLCHEFIHFLVMHDNYDKLTNNSNFTDFTNEALTESLARNIYSELENVSGYAPQVNMMDFANLMMDKANNYGAFLKDGSDGFFSNSDNLSKFKSEVESYHSKFENKGFRLFEARNDEEYISAQRHLISIFVQVHYINTVDQYAEVLEKLSHRPVADEEFISNLLDQIEDQIIRSISLDSDKKVFESKLRNQLKEIRERYKKCKFFLHDEVSEFEYDGMTLFIGKDNKLKIVPPSMNGVWRYVGTDPNEGTMTLKTQSSSTKEFINTKTLYFKDLKFNKTPIQGAVIKTKQMINTHTKSDISAIYSALDTDKEIVSIERFDLPNVSGGKNTIFKYVVKYTDGIEILDSLEPEDVVEDVTLADFKGIAGESPKNGLIWFENKKNISGYSLSSATPTRLNSLRQKEIAEILQKTFSKGTIDQTVQRYKESGKYDPNLDDDDIEYTSLYWLAGDLVKIKPEEYFEEIDKKIKSELPEIVIYTDGDEIGMGTFKSTVYDAEKTVLYSKNGGGLYDEFVPTLKRTGAKREVSNLYKVNKDGSLVLNSNTTKKSQHILKEQAEKLKEKPEKVDRPTKLSDYWGKGKISEEEKREFEKEFDEYDESEDLDELRRELAEETDEDFDDIDDFMEEDIIVDDIDPISHVDTPRVGGRRRIM